MSDSNTSTGPSSFSPVRSGVVTSNIVKEIRVPSIEPFTAETLWQAGYPRNWEDLRRVVRPWIGRNFVVTDVASQASVDALRRLLDSSFSPDKGTGVVHAILTSEADGDAELLKAVLEAGADHDVASKDGWRASHVCGCLTRIDAAAVVFICRPDMAAVNVNKDTPLAAAQKKTYKGDDEKKARHALRPDVAKLIIDGKYHEGKFPTIAELACRRKWFAVRNLIRRQVVPASEYQAKYHGNSAAEWARMHDEDIIAKEIEYYAGLPTANLLEAEAAKKSLQSRIRSLQSRIRSLQSENESLEWENAVLETEREMILLIDGEFLRERLAEMNAGGPSDELKEAQATIKSLRKHLAAGVRKIATRDKKVKVLEAKVKGGEKKAAAELLEVQKLLADQTRKNQSLETALAELEAKLKAVEDKMRAESDVATSDSDDSKRLKLEVD